MVCRSFTLTAFALAVGLCASSTGRAQSNLQRPNHATVDTAARDFDGIPAGEIPVWKTLTLGIYRDVNRLLEALDSLDCGRADMPPDVREFAGLGNTTAPLLPCSLGDWAGEIIARPAFTLSKAKTDVSLVVVSVGELGFANEATVAQVQARGRQLGLELCPAEVGPLLRLRYLDQPIGEFLRVAMEPIATYGGDLVDLTLANGGASLALIGGPARVDAMVHASVRYVFVRPTRVAKP